MFERFTDPAKQVVALAQGEARALAHTSIGTEHLLLGLVAHSERESSPVLADPVSLAAVRAQVEGLAGRGEHEPAGEAPFAPEGKEAVVAAAREAEELGHGHVGVGHLLLGLLSQRESLACRTLVALGVDLDAARERGVALAWGEAPAESGLRSWGGSDPLSDRVVRARARARAERDPVHEGNPDGWDVLARAGGATLRALAVARRHAADGLRGEIAPIDLVVGVLAVDDPEVRGALAEAGAQEPSPDALAGGYRDHEVGDDVVTELSGESRRACSMAARLAGDDGPGITPGHLLLAALEVLGPVRSAAAADRLGAQEVALRPALLRRTVTAPGALHDQPTTP